ncbi:hypothetical protein F5Y16DRAFT_382135 [Xylariaceae sp. FL0255]|nr:hypothetical protein F5Y16DRAFT_382135 [Xylariaceae sp. FL0255]
MPPNIIKQSRNKMQAWVTTNKVANGLPASPAPAAVFDAAVQNQTRHVNIARSAPAPAPPASQAASPPRSRAPIVNANSQRAVAANGPRIPLPSRPSHSREGSLNLPSRNRAISSEPLQTSARQQAFWDQSTIDGSAFSDTASNMESTAPFSRRNHPVQPPSLKYEQQPDVPPRHHRPAPPLSEPAEEPPPFVIGPNGMINVLGNGSGNGLTRSASTPDARGQRGGLKNVNAETGREPYSDGSQYHSSPEKTPSAKRLNHAKGYVIRTERRDSYTERADYPNGDGAMKSPQKPQIHVNPAGDAVEEFHPDQTVRPLRLQISDHQPQRSTIFADTDTPMVSHQDESEAASVERQPTPKPAPVSKPKQQTTNRTLFPKGSKGKVGSLRESALPRTVTEKRPSTSRKRSYELDYDDGALANMDYAALKQESFDYDPARAEARSAVEPPQGTMAEKLTHFSAKDEASQGDFFTKMSIKEWEEAGDWFLEQFGEVMNRFKAARKAKRDITAAFENEIAEREEAVRNKTHGIAHILAELKSEGEGMMQNKELD